MPKLDEINFTVPAYITVAKGWGYRESAISIKSVMNNITIKHQSPANLF